MNYKVSWVTDNHSTPNVWIPCQGCDGRIVFNREEILALKAAGSHTSTPCRYCGWHPPYPPEPWNELPVLERQGLGFVEK